LELAVRFFFGYPENTVTEQETRPDQGRSVPSEPEQSVPATPTAVAEQSEQAQRRGADNSEDRGSQPANEIRAVKKELGDYERSTLRLTWIIVGINLFTCAFVGLQWREMKSSSVDTRALADAAKKQSEKMSDMSDAADKIRQAAQDMVVQDQRIADNAQHSLDTSIATSRLDQRAWVSIEVGERNGTFSVAMKNTGKTPALNVIYDAQFRGGGRGQIPEVLPPDPQRNLLRFLIPPGEAQTASVYEMNYLHAFNLGGDRNYVQGDIVYDDVFGKTHHTIYCYWTEPPPIRQPGVFPPSVFTICGTHNKMD
jgi:hypothetical protein